METSRLASADDTTVSPQRVRLQYTAYLILGFVLSVLFKRGVLVDSIPTLDAGCKVVGDATEASHCRGLTAVYRISFSVWLFYTIMLVLSRCGRPSIQTGHWGMKTLLFLLLLLVPFFISNSVFVVWAYICSIGAGFYLMAQIIILIDFAWQWNETWAEHEDQRWQYGLLAVLVFLLTGALVLVILMYVWFTKDPTSQCSLNTFFVTFTMLLAIILVLETLLVQRHDTGSASLFTTAVVVAYSTYLCFSALSSGNTTATCNHFYQASGSDFDWTIIVSSTFVCLSLAWAVLGAGSSRDSFRRTSAVVEESAEDPATFSFSHLISALAAMYVAMLFAGWEVLGSSNQEGSSIDSGLTSMWVKMVSQWVTVVLYGWTMVAPIACPNRNFDAL